MPVEQAAAIGWELPEDVRQTHEVEAEQARKLEQALEICPFKRTPELERSVESYYDLNNNLDGMIQDTLAGDETLDATQKDEKARSLTAILESGLMRPDEIERHTEQVVTYGRAGSKNAQEATVVLASIQLSLLSDPMNKRLHRAELMAAARANEVLFAEPSVGITTLSQTEKQKVIDNHAAIQAKIKQSGLFTPEGYMIDRAGEKMGETRYVDNVRNNPLANVEAAEQTFWEDVRFGGQLLFHNTNSFGEVYSANALKTRRMQLAETGTFNTPNLPFMGDRLHSPTPHWSEQFDDHNYRNGVNKVVGTIAIPLAEIIKTTPYGRGAEYGALQLKDAAVEDLVPRVVINDGIANIGSGNADQQGRYGTDRTFYSSPHDVSPETPLEQAPDGYAIPLRETSTWVQLGDEVAKTGMTFGIGEHMPQQYVIDVKGVFENGDMERDAYNQQRRAAIADAIQTLQHDSIRKYGSTLVVPLRSNVVDFWVPDDTVSNGRHMAEFNMVSPEVIAEATRKATW